MNARHAAAENGSIRITAPFAVKRRNPGTYEVTILQILLGRRIAAARTARLQCLVLPGWPLHPLYADVTQSGRAHVAGCHPDHNSGIDHRQNSQ